jgi:hypothetical protein
MAARLSSAPLEPMKRTRVAPAAVAAVPIVVSSFIATRTLAPVW